MKVSKVSLALLVVVVLLGISSAVMATQLNPGITPPNEQYIQLSQKWIQWAFSEPFETNPVCSPTGAFAANGQPTTGNVFFLAGLMGGTGISSAERTISIPAGTRLFFPVINYFDVEWELGGSPPDMVWQDPTPGYFAALYAEAAALCVANAPGMYATIDGRAVRNLTGYRTITPLFNMTIPRENLLAWWGYPDVWGTLGPNMADGYYLLLEPLTPGQHVIEFGQYDWPMHIRYDITVKP